LENVPKWWVVLDDKWKVADGSGGGIGWAIAPVATRVNSTFMANCGEGSLRIYQSGGWWWVRNGKW